MPPPDQATAATILAVSIILLFLNNVSAYTERTQYTYTGSPIQIEADFVDAHNEVRAEYNEPPLAWDAKLAAFAQNWAVKTNSLNKCEEMYHSHGPYGENLFWGDSYDDSWSPRAAVRKWSDEREDFNLKTLECKSGEMCGHFTQIVWRNTKRVGCCRTHCAKGGVLMNCNYDPPGNWLDNNPTVRSNPFASDGSASPQDKPPVQPRPVVIHPNGKHLISGKHNPLQPLVGRPQPVQPLSQPQPVHIQPAQPVPIPHPAQPFMKPLQAQPFMKPLPAQPVVRPQPAQPIAKLHPAQPFPKPQPAQPVARPQPTHLQPVQPVVKPQPVQPVVKPQQVQPQPVQPVVKPQPAQPGPGGKPRLKIELSGNTIVVRPLVKPQPVQPQPVQPVVKPQPAQPGTGGKPRVKIELSGNTIVVRPLVKPQPVQPVVKPQPVQPAVKPQPAQPGTGGKPRVKIELSGNTIVVRPLAKSQPWKEVAGIIGGKRRGGHHPARAQHNQNSNLRKGNHNPHHLSSGQRNLNRIHRRQRMHRKM